MKTIFNKKITIAFAALLLCITSTKAQVPQQLKKTPAYKWPALIHSSLHKPHAAGILHTMRCTPTAPCLKNQITLGGSGDDNGQIIIPTNDGGFVVCGGTYSYTGELHTTDTINGDAFVAKYNKFRKLEWAKTYGGSGSDYLYNIIQTYDGGYVAVGYTSSNDGDVSGNHGGADVWVVKLNASGKIIWQKCFGGSNDETGWEVVQTVYGGYAIAANTNSNDGDVSGNHNTDGNSDGWFIQVSPVGKLLFQHCYGGSDYDDFEGIVRADFGSYVLMGNTYSNDGDVSGNHGSPDVWVIKINAIGKIDWEKTVGGSNGEYIFPNAIAKTKDGNIVIDGGTNSVDGDFTNPENTAGGSFIAKINSNAGKIMWSKAYTDPASRFALGVFATRDDGIVETGSGGGTDADGFNVLISKYDKNGNEEWYKQLGGSDFDLAVAGYEGFNGDLNIVAQTASTDGDVKKSDGGLDTWLLLLGPCGVFEDNNTPVSLSETNKIISNNSTSSLSIYPNPVYNATTISFSLAQSQQVSLQVFDMSGRLIKILANENMQPGNHQLIWNTTNNNGATVASGIYFLKLQAGSVVQTKEMAVVQ